MVANYFWLLTEGVHLQLLLIWPMKVKQFTKQLFISYMVFGWGKQNVWKFVVNFCAEDQTVLDY